MTSPPTVIAGSQINTGEGCSSIANANGQLLFYTDGINVWDASHSLMSNGNGLMGNSSTTQSGVIVRRPGSATYYYIFTQDDVGGSDGFRYSEVDMSMNSGLGAVVSKNVPLHTPSCEKLTSVRHCNGTDIWVITHDVGNNMFRNFLVTSNGINSAPVTSAVTPNNSALLGTLGSVKASPDGTKLGVALYGDNAFAVYDFDASTGQVSNPIVLYQGNSGNSDPYGCEFSPDGSKFYGATCSTGKIIQWDLTAGNNQAIIGSSYTVSSGNTCGSLQLAIDGKIYYTRAGSGGLSIINSPNLPGPSCAFVSNGLAMSTGTCNLGLPNFITSSFAAQTPQFSYSVNCAAGSFSAPAINKLNGYPVNSIKWIFGDPGSGSANTSTISNPVHNFTGAGVFTVSLIYYYNCGTDTTKQVLNVQPCISVQSNSITCASLGTATVFPVGGIGPFNYTWAPANQTGSVATGLNPGAYTITVFDAGTNATFSATTVFTSLIPLTGTLNSTFSSSCHGATNTTANIAPVSGGSGKENYVWTNGSSTFTTAVVNSLSGGLWTVTVTDALTACKIQNVFYVTQPPPVTINISSGSPTACTGSGVSFTAVSSGGVPGYSYQWANGPSQQGHSVMETSAGTYIYSVTTLDSNSCAKSGTISVDFIAKPVVSVANISVCPSASGTLVATGATNYTWSTSFTNSFMVASPPATTSYTVTGEKNGCSSTTTALIILKPSPVALISSNSPQCENSDLKFFSNGGSTYQWSGPHGYFSGLQNPSFSNAKLSDAGVYQVTVTAPNSCTALASTTVTVNQNPTVTAFGSTVCTIQNATLSCNSIGGISFEWRGTSGIVSKQQDATFTNPHLTNSGNYTVVAFSAQGCTNSAAAHLLVINPPSLLPVLSTNSICAQALNGSPNSVFVNVSGALTYSINVPAYIQVTPLPGAASMTLTSVAPYNNSVTVPAGTLFGANGVCTISTTLHFSVVPNPTISVSSLTPEICAGQSFTFTNNGAPTYTWNSGAPDLSVNQGGAVAIAKPGKTTVYSVFGGNLGCNSASKTSTLTVYPIPTVFVDPPESKICLGTSTLLTASGSSTEFFWQPKTGLNQIQGNIILASPQLSQVYTVTGIANNCTNTALAEITVLALPNPVALASKQLYCANETIFLSGDGGEAYYWNGPDNFTQSGKEIILEGFSTIPGDYTLTVTDKNTCVNHTSIPVKIAQLPQGSLTGPKMEACVPFCSEFYYQNPAGGQHIVTQWRIDHKIISSKTFTHCFVKTGDQVVTGKFTDTLTQCESTQTFVVKGLQVPVADFNWSPEKPVESLDDVLFGNNSYGGDQNKFNWFFLNNDGYTSRNENTSFRFAEAGNYPVAFIVGNSHGCSDTIVKYVTIEQDFNFFMPNSFTPNGDDRNDFFVPVTRGVREYWMVVVDRWGEKVFETTDPGVGWDGGYKEMPCKQDVYAWKVILSTKSGASKQYSGSVTLIR